MAAAGGFLLRTLPLTVLVSLWWLVPVYVQNSYGIDFLKFTEQPGTVWSTTSITESLRLMSFWLSYVGIGFAGRAIPFFDDSRLLLFSAPVVVGTLLIPGLALAGFLWTRRWRYGPFFLLMALVGLLVMGAGFPDGTPLRHGLYFVYNHVASVRFLRASYKAAPLVAIALACLAGVAAQAGWRRLGGVRHVNAWRALGAALVAAVLALAAWPMVTGRAQDAQVSFKRVPTAWHQAAAQLDRELPVSSRAMVLPGDLFSFYTWGGTVDPILPALSRRPVAERTEVPYANLRATDLLWTIDGLVHQQRLLPGQLGPLLSLIGVRSVITPTDDDLARSDAPPPADIAAELAAQPGFAHPARAYGPVGTFQPDGRLGPAWRLPEIRRYDLPSARPLVRVEPQTAPVVVDGSAAALAGLAGFGSLPAGGPLEYSGDLTASGLRQQLAGGGRLVISDSNRRQAFVAASLEQNTGPVLTPGQTVSADGMILDPFGRGPDFETVAAYSGVRSVEAPYSPQRPQFPEHAPFAAIDGSPQTAWLADPTLAPSQRVLQVDFVAPIDVPYVDLLPYNDAGGSVRRVQIAGRSFAVGPGWNRLPLGLHGVSSLQVALTDVTPPAPGHAASGGGIRELRIPGIQAHEALRLPLDSATALQGQNLDPVDLEYLFQRTTGDQPFGRDPAHPPYSAFDVHRPGDAEQTIDRLFALPVSRRFQATAWTTAAPQAPDDALDRLAGYRGPARATSSSRFDGLPGVRASRALDGDPHTAWIGDWDPGVPAWIQWRSPRLETARTLQLLAPAGPVRRPTRVRVQWPGGATGPLAVGPSGTVTLPHVVHARAFRIDVLAASLTPGASPADRRAVGIAEIRGIDGLPHIASQPAGALSAPCGSVRLQLGGRTMALRVSGTIAAFDAGTPLRASSCGAPVPLAAGTQHLVVDLGPLLVDNLSLVSPAPRPLAQAAHVSGRVISPGTAGRGAYQHVRVLVSRPSWLVLGEGYNRGWQASCDGHSLGTPVPLDGYANAWRVGPGCRDVSFKFAPNRLALGGYIVSAVVAIICLLLIGLGWRRHERVRAAASAWLEVGDRPAPWAPQRALLAALLAAIPFGFIFGIRSGLVAFPLTAFALWRGIGARWLILLAGGLLVIVVPILYLLHPGDESGGSYATYAYDHIRAHWVGVAAVGLLIGALWRTLEGSALRRRE